MWISVKKLRPEKDDVILATGLVGKRRTFPGVVRYLGRGKYQSLDKPGTTVTGMVTHWQPLPPPPKEEE